MFTVFSFKFQWQDATQATHSSKIFSKHWFLWRTKRTLRKWPKPGEPWNSVRLFRRKEKIFPKIFYEGPARQILTAVSAKSNLVCLQLNLVHDLTTSFYDNFGIQFKHNLAILFLWREDSNQQCKSCLNYCNLKSIKLFGPIFQFWMRQILHFTIHLTAVMIALKYN